MTVIVVELIALKSAIPPGGKRLLISTIRKRNRVTEAPVLFWKRLLIESVPGVKSVTGVKSRKRFGDDGAPTVASSSNAGIDVAYVIRNSTPVAKAVRRMLFIGSPFRS